MPDVKIIQVQHHWAHIASVLVEHGLEGPVIGLAADGTGYGTDGAIWGCECLIASLEKFERFGHLSYYRLAGGDKASKEAMRPALSLLMKAYGSKFNLEEFDWLLSRIESDKSRIKMITEQLNKDVNCVETSSLGRVFDAVAVMLGLGDYNHFDAQLPMALESIIAGGIEELYDFELINTSDKSLQPDLGRAIKQIIDDIRNGLPAGVVSAKFHNTIAAVLMDMAKAARESTRLDTAALSGGVFCNRYLSDRLIMSLKKAGFSVLFNRDVPSNDGGISLGQAAVAARLVGGESLLLP
jgi:hydrogenase maturation protein HypF